MAAFAMLTVTVTAPPVKFLAFHSSAFTGLYCVIPDTIFVQMLPRLSVMEVTVAVSRSALTATTMRFPDATFAPKPTLIGDSE